MALSRDFMIEKMMVSDSSFNGRFIIGVLTTKIYCLPSCRAKRPKPENVQFFKNSAEAKAAGLRPCKLCKPDLFEKGIDPELDRLEEVADKARKDPGAFPSVDSLADAVCVSVSTLHQQFRDHFQSSPGTFLNRARIDAACQALLNTGDEAAQVASGVGFDSTSGFYESFRKMTGMTPVAYRELPRKNAFRIALPPEYPIGELLKVLARDPESVSDSLVDNLCSVGFTFQGRANVLKMRIETDAVHCEVDGDDTLASHKVAVRILNLRQDPITFERQASDMGFTRLFECRHGMRIPQTATVFDGVIWVILGQQVNFRFAATMRRRLTELAGTPKAGLFCTPDAEQVAVLDHNDLLKLQFSRQKADYLLSISRQIAEGKLDLEGLLTQSATRVSKTLHNVRGLGVWSVNYLMMRTLGFADCVPLGDTGISSGLQKLFALDHRPNPDEVAALMKPFAPYRSLACYHLWRGF